MCPSANPALSTPGELIKFSGTHCWVRLDVSCSELIDKSRIVISVQGPRGLRILGLVSHASDSELEVRILRVVHKDKRDYPRVSAAIDLRYHLVSVRDSDTIQNAWKQGIQEISHVLEWTTPHNFVNFRRSGLQFTDKSRCVVGNRMMLEIQLPDSSIIHRLIGIVVRVEKLDEAVRSRSFEAVQKSRPEDTHSVAVRFHGVANSVEEALSRATVDQQMREIEWRQAENAKPRR